MRGCCVPTAPLGCRGVLLLLLIGPTSARANADPPASSSSSVETVTVTWPDILRLLQRHPRLVAGQFDVAAARGGVQVAAAIPNPVLDAEIDRGMARTGAATRLEWGLTLTIPLGWLARRGANVDVAEAEVDVAVAESKTLRRELLLQLRTMFWGLVYDQARVAVLAALEAQTLELVRAVQRRVEKGEVRPVEATRVEIELERNRGELEAAQTAVSFRRAELSIWLGIPPTQALVAMAELEALPSVLDRDSALSQARTLSPVLAAARAKVRALEAAVRSETRARVPAFDVKGFAATELDRRAYGFGLVMDLPVWNWNAGGIAQAEALLAAGEKTAEAARWEFEMAVLDAQHACHASVVTATRLKDNVMPRSEMAAATLEKTYRIGEASLLDVLDARRTLADSHRLYLSALAQAQLDCSRLDALAQEEIP